jgi:pyruvate dehydrogenase E2 component (dihydrolipoamide acetyltransferase)
MAESRVDSGNRVPLTRMRRAISKAMTLSAQIPQFTIELDAQLGTLVELRDRVRGEGHDFSFSDVFTAASARSLVEHPDVNSSFDDEGILRHADVNVGIAVSIDDGLVAPAIRNADRRNLEDIAAERVRLTKAAKEDTLAPADLLSATFTISNLGPLGIRRFRALVVPPQAAILAIGKLTADDVCSLSLSCDHRVLDGVPGARFLMSVVELVEQPDWLNDLL